MQVDPAFTCWAVSCPAHLVEGHSEAALSLGGSHFLEGTVVTLVTSQKCLPDVGQLWLQGGESHTWNAEQASGATGSHCGAGGYNPGKSTNKRALMRLKLTLTYVTINVIALAFGNESKIGNLECNKFKWC